VDERIITVKTRKEFIDHFRKIFIPNCEKGDNEFFNFGWAINNWTMFFIKEKDGIYTTVELVEEKK
jgi:hypothetical protein